MAEPDAVSENMGHLAEPTELKTCLACGVKAERLYPDPGLDGYVCAACGHTVTMICVYPPE